MVPNCAIHHNLWNCFLKENNTSFYGKNSCGMQLCLTPGWKKNLRKNTADAVGFIWLIYDKYIIRDKYILAKLSLEGFTFYQKY